MQVDFALDCHTHCFILTNKHMNPITRNSDFSLCASSDLSLHDQQDLPDKEDFIPTFQHLVFPYSILGTFNKKYETSQSKTAHVRTITFTGFDIL